MPTLKETLAPVLAKIGIEDGKVAALFNADGTELTAEAPNTLLQHDATRVATIKTASKTEGFNEGHQKGTKDSLEKVEKDMKEKYGITSDKKGTELVDEIITTKSTAKAPELEVDKVKVHPEYLRMQDELTKKTKDADAAWKEKYEARDKEIAKTETFAKVKAQADAILAELQPVLPEDQKKADTQKKLLYDALFSLEFKANENDKENFVILKDGKVYEDAHGARRDLKSIVTETAQGIWDFKEGKARTTSPAANTNDTDPAKAKAAKLASVKTPQNEKEYMKMITEEKDPDMRIAIQDTWDKSQAGSK